MNEKHIKLQLAKFNLYGFFKNLRFFDPFLLLYLTYNNMSLTQIGTLWAIREVFIYVLEIPSGVLADNYGRRSELLLCFGFYILSFVVFYFGNNFYHFAIAFSLYGMGEAFRSGTHKAMIMDFMDHHNIKTNKSKIYGKTRSYSMIGSMVSSLLSILLVAILDDLSLLFLIAIIPYLVDFVLILSYPNYLNRKTRHRFSIKEFFQETVFVVFSTMRNKSLRRVLLDSASYNAIFKTIKDYIQLIVLSLLVVSIGTSPESVNTVEVVLASIYAGMFLLSAIASRFSHLLVLNNNKEKVLNYIWVLTSVTALLLILFNENIVLTIILFSLFYILLNFRKPIMVEKISDESNKEERSSILSIESQITSLIIIILAPVFGLVFDRFGIDIVFMTVSIIGLISVSMNISNSKRQKTAN